MNSLIFIRRLLYSLKRQYGLVADIYKITAGSDNLETGVRTVTKLKQHVHKAVLLPANLSTKFQYDLSYIAANKNFTYGGFFDQRARRMIFDARDLPKGYKIESEDFIITANKKYQVKSVEELEQNQGYLVSMIELVGQKVYEVHTVNVTSSFRILQTAVKV